MIDGSFLVEVLSLGVVARCQHGMEGGQRSWALYRDWIGSIPFAAYIRLSGIGRYVATANPLILAQFHHRL